MAIRGSESLGPDVRQLHALMSSHRIGPRYCERPGCLTATREGKPFCSDHVEDHPRVRRLLATIRQREREVQAIARRGSNAVRSDHLIVAEVVTHLRATGKQTLERLAKDTGLPLMRLVAEGQALGSAPTMAHACPSCGAPVGHSCLSEQGRAVRNHAARPGAL